MTAPIKPNRRALLTASLGVAVAATPLGRALADSGEVTLPRVTDLAADARIMRERGLPMLLMVSQTHCGYCEEVKREVIRPMIISGDYDDRVLIREILIDPFDKIPDFDGTPRDPNVIAARYKAWVTPTLLFLGPDGEVLSERILGVNTPEMYGWYVDSAIDEALGKLRDGAG
ncbi:MAG: thioredoxin family protein [Gammaproteobacteria bacterium]